jgi:hypothetical protein
MEDLDRVESRRMRRLGLVALLLLAAPAVAAPTASAVHVRGTRSLERVLPRLALAERGEEPRLVVVLADPSVRVVAAVRRAAKALAGLKDALPPGSVVLLAEVGAKAPDPAEPQDLAAAVKAGKARSGVRNLLEAVRRVVRAGRGWRGPRHVLLVAEVGVELEEEADRTLDALRRGGWRMSVASGEAPFARPWTWRPALPPGFLLRTTGHPDHRRDTAYPGCDVPFPDTPGSWDLGLAPTAFVRAPSGKRVPRAFVLPSGFGYAHLARLCAETGGRYYLVGFAASKGKGGLNLEYDYGLMRLFEPDLRSRGEILAELPRRPLVTTIYRIWERLAQPSVGVIRRRPPISLTGPSRVSEETDTIPNRPIHLSFSGPGETVWVADTLRQRLREVEAALATLAAAIGEDRRTRTRGVPGVRHRWLAQADLMRLQLLRVRFHLGEILASLLDIREEELHNESIHLRRRTLYRGSMPERGASLPAEPRQLVFLHEAVGETERMEETYEGTPWGYAARCGELFTWDIVTHAKGGSRPVVRARSRGKKDDTPARKPRPKPSTPRPGSTGGETPTGGG